MSLLNPRTLRGQGVLLPAALLLLAVSIFAFLVWTQLREAHFDRLRLEAERVAQRLESRSTRTRVAEGSVGLSGILDVGAFDTLASVLTEAVEHEPSVVYAAVSTKEHGVLIVLQGGQWSFAEDDESRWSRLSASSADMEAAVATSPIDAEEVFHAAKPLALTEGGPTLGHLHLGFGIEGYRQALLAVNRRVLMAVGIVFLIGLPISLAVFQKIVAPIERLTEFSKKLAGGDLQERTEVGGADEIVLLGGTMNHMAQELEKAGAERESALRQEAALREKDILLREIHHRVKNNMQVLSGLLQMQARTTDSEKTREILNDSDSRIRTIASLHQRLYESQEFSQVALRGYFEGLVGQLRRLYDKGDAVTFAVEVEESFVVELDTALPLGLAVNELITNSLKHGFPPGQTGTITIRIRVSETDSRFSLEVEDTGVGLTEEFSLDSSRSLGCRLIRMLAEQLDGVAEVQSRRPATIVLRSLQQADYPSRT